MGTWSLGDSHQPPRPLSCITLTWVSAKPQRPESGQYANGRPAVFRKDTKILGFRLRVRSSFKDALVTVSRLCFFKTGNPLRGCTENNKAFQYSTG